MRYVPHEPMPSAASPLGSDFLLPRWSSPALRVLDGPLLATASSSAVELWDLSAERARGRFELEGQVRAFDASGRWIAAADDRTSQIEVATVDGDAVATIAHTPCPHALALSPDARWVVYGGGGYKKTADKRLHVADVSTGAKVAELKGGRGPVRSLAFSPDGSMLAAAIDSSARIWSAAAMPTLGAPRVLAHGDTVLHVSFSPDGETLYTLTQHEARAWSVSSLAEQWCFARQGHRSASFRSIARTEHGVAVVFDHTISLLDARGEPSVEVVLGARPLDGLAVLGDTLFVGEWFANRVRRFTLPALTEHVLPGPDARLEQLVVSPDEQQALSCGWDRKAELWHIASGRRLRAFSGPAYPYGGPAHAGCFLPDGSIVLAFGPELRRFAPGRDEPVWSRRHEHGWDISLLIASHDGALVIACDAASRRTYGHVSVMDASTGHERVMQKLSWTIDHARVEGELVLLLGSSVALTLDPQKGEIVKERRIEGSYWGTGTALSPDGRTCTRPASRMAKETRWTVHDLERDEGVVTIDLGEDSYPAGFALSGAVMVARTPVGLRYFDAVSGAELGEVVLGRPPRIVRSIRDRDVVALDTGALHVIERPPMELSRPQRSTLGVEDVVSLFEVEPSAEAWKVACAALDRTDDPEILERVERTAERWPDRLRAAPPGWIDDAISGRPQPRLRIVRTLRAKHLRSSGARALVALPELRLAILDVCEGELEAEDAIAIAERWPDLEELRLYHVELGPKAAKGLAGVPFTRLERLDLGGNKLTGAAVAPLLHSPGLSRLRYLALDRNKKLAHERSIEAIATSEQLANLCALDLSFSGIPIDALVRAKHLTALRSLEIDERSLTDDDLVAIARAPHLARLEFLSLGSTYGITRVGLAALEERLTSLRSFSCYPHDRSAFEGLARLSAARERYGGEISTGFATWGWRFEHERIR